MWGAGGLYPQLQSPPVKTPAHAPGGGVVAPVQLPAVRRLRAALPQASLRRAGSRGTRRGKQCWQFSLEPDRIRAPPIRKVTPLVCGSWWGGNMRCDSLLVIFTSTNRISQDMEARCRAPPDNLRGTLHRDYQAMGHLSDLCSVQPAQLSTTGLL